MFPGCALLSDLSALPEVTHPDSIFRRNWAIVDFCTFLLGKEPRLNFFHYFQSKLCQVQPDCEKEHHFVVELGPGGHEDAGSNVGLKG